MDSPIDLVYIIRKDARSPEETEQEKILRKDARSPEETEQEKILSAYSKSTKYPLPDCLIPSGLCCIPEYNYIDCYDAALYLLVYYTENQKVFERVRAFSEGKIYILPNELRCIAAEYPDIFTRVTHLMYSCILQPRVLTCRDPDCTEISSNGIISESVPSGCTSEYASNNGYTSTGISSSGCIESSTGIVSECVSGSGYTESSTGITIRSDESSCISGSSIYGDSRYNSSLVSLGTSVIMSINPDDYTPYKYVNFRSAKGGLSVLTLTYLGFSPNDISHRIYIEPFLDTASCHTWMALLKAGFDLSFDSRGNSHIYNIARSFLRNTSHTYISDISVAEVTAALGSENTGRNTYRINTIEAVRDVSIIHNAIRDSQFTKHINELGMIAEVRNENIKVLNILRLGIKAYELSLADM